MFRCKASGALRNEAYNGYAAVTKKPDNAADGRFAIFWRVRENVQMQGVRRAEE